MRVQKIEGLESLPQDDLTPEEIGQIEIAKEEAEEAKKEQTDIDILLNALADKEDAPKAHDIKKTGILYINQTRDDGQRSPRGRIGCP